jgi:acetyltransferase-like isoleucine patch superfamily enzyme
MTRVLTRAVGVVRRHSALLNFARNSLHLLRGRRVSPGAWLIVDGVLRLGPRATVGRGCRLSVPAGGVLDLGERVWLNHDVQIDVLEKITIGACTTVQRFCSLIGDIEIGRGCLLAPNVFVSSGRHHFDVWPAVPIRIQDSLAAEDTTLGRRDSRPPVRIGDDCWLGVNTVVQPGVTIGRGVVVGANSVVVHDVAPYQVVGGVPARQLGSRLDFVPPRMLDGECAAQLPYFYSGFEYGNAKPPVADGDFVLALALSQATGVRLTLRGVGSLPVAIECGGARGVVPPGATVDLEVPAASASESNRLRVRLPAGGRVAVLHALVLAGAVVV